MLKFIEQTAREAGNILMKYYNGENKITRKKDLGYVGEADLASEKYILDAIEKSYPSSHIISEEEGELNKELSGNGMTWIIDPLDGTTNFVHRFPFFAVSIGVMINGELSAGAVYNPASDELFSAQQGKGAFLNGQKICVSKIREFNDSLCITGFYYFQGEKLYHQIERFKRVQEATLSVRRLGAAALDICYVACGRAEGFWEEGLNSWDVAAGTLILQESGGIFSDFSGKTGSIFGNEFIYSNNYIQEDLLKILHL